MFVVSVLHKAPRRLEPKLTSQLHPHGLALLASPAPRPHCPLPAPSSRSAPNPRALCDSFSRTPYSLHHTAVPRRCILKPTTSHRSRRRSPPTPTPGPARLPANGAASLLLAPLAHRQPERALQNTTLIIPPPCTQRPSSFPPSLQENPKSLQLTKVPASGASSPQPPLLLSCSSPASTTQASLLSPSEPVHLLFPPWKCLPPEAPVAAALPSRSLPKYPLLRASQDPSVQCPSTVTRTP